MAYKVIFAPTAIARLEDIVRYIHLLSRAPRKPSGRSDGFLAFSSNGTESLISFSLAGLSTINNQLRKGAWPRKTNLRGFYVSLGRGRSLYVLNTQLSGLFCCNQSRISSAFGVFPLLLRVASINARKFEAISEKRNQKTGRPGCHDYRRENCELIY